ncbi:MAG: hypothetical protein ACFCVE_11770 [Phycisphaerae bacterium]
MTRTLITAGLLILLAVGIVGGLSALAANGKRAAAEMPAQPQRAWSQDSIWYDGLVEKATYDASRIVYGRARSYEAVFLTNKEAHDAATVTKDADSAGESFEVWKHNQIERIPTPNYDYTYIATSHFRTDNLALTRLDVSSQEWCGTSFKQYQLTAPGTWDYFGFSYMPESGRQNETVTAAGKPVVPFDALPLWLRNYDFEARPTVEITLLPDQRSNRATPAEPAAAEVRHVGTSDAGHKLELVQAGKVLGTYEMAADRNHVMLAYEGADGQTYTLRALERVNYWTIQE